MKSSTQTISILFTITSILRLSLSVNDTITTTHPIRDGQTIVSSGGNFELGFFSPGSSKNRYVGIWYKKIPVRTVIWVANRETPVTNTSGILKIISPGILVLSNETNGVVWSTDGSRTRPRNPVVQLLDSGNLVLKDGEDGPETILWQSFDHPTDTLLPGMKLGRNFKTGQEFYMSSWKSNDDPGQGEFSYHCDPAGYPQNVLRKGRVKQYETGPWDGITFSGLPSLRKNPIFRFGLVMNESEVYYHYELLNGSIISRFALTPTGLAQRSTWDDQKQDWIVYLIAPSDTCDTYGFCGTYGNCKNAVCECLDKFVPRDPVAWNRGDWSDGCVRRTALESKRGDGDGFLKFTGVKLPDTENSWHDERMSLDECRNVCLKNSSCMAYTNLNISIRDANGNGNGCLIWFGDLVDIKDLPTTGQDIYIRIDRSELVSAEAKERHREPLMVILSVALAIFLLTLCLALYFVSRKMISNRPKLRESGRFRSVEQENTNKDESQRKDVELPHFDLETIVKATDDFSMNNKIGEGGFGPVYKGLLEDGTEIAVKQLSRTSIQGVDAFKNEVICLVKLQHRNLVRLLGCCIQGEENMLVYEYMTNRSLDLILFDPMKSIVLDWPKRFNIINGIARGLLYLHQDSCLRIIHRDLKASNILLDADLNPKISDFGLARSFGGNETGAETSRVAGTYGYMSPEYVVDGQFSLKSDVFSFGVLVLEIVSGKRNRGFSHVDHHLNLLGHAWILYKEGRALELADSSMEKSFGSSEVIRSIHVGLLCVQQRPDDRPSMSSVVLMLGNDGVLPPAQKPGFFTEREILDNSDWFSSNTNTSAHDITITQLQPR